MNETRLRITVQSSDVVDRNYDLDGENGAGFVEHWTAELFAEEVADDLTLELDFLGFISATRVNCFRGDDVLQPLDLSADEISAAVYASVVRVLDSELAEFEPGLNLEGYAPDVLVLNSMAVLSEHRGNNYGLLLLRSLCDKVGRGCGVFVGEVACLKDLDAFALLTERRQKQLTPILHESRDRPLERLLLYYKQLGFRQIGETNYIYFDPCQKWRKI